MISGRSRAAGITASTDPTSTARWMLWMPSNSAATSLIFSARIDARSSACSTSSRLRSAPRASPIRASSSRTAGLAAVRFSTSPVNTTAAAGRAADDRGERALDGEHRHVRVERLGEHHERAAVVARDHGEHDRPTEVDDRAADLGAVLELQVAHRVGRPVEAGQVRQHDERPVAAGRVDRPGRLLRRLREQRAGGVGVGAVGRREPAAADRSRLDAEQADRDSRRGGRPGRRRSRRRPCRPSARGSRGPGRRPPASRCGCRRPSCGPGWSRTRRSRRPS